MNEKRWAKLAVLSFLTTVALVLASMSVIVEKTKEVNNLKAELEQRELTIETWEIAHQELSEEFDSLKSERDSLLDDSWTAKQTLQKQTKQLNELKKENKLLRKEIDQLKSKIAKENDRILASQRVAGYKTMNVQATYYTAFCDTGCTGKTATGYDVSNTIYYDGLRIVAVDKSIIPLGTKLRVETPYQTFDAIAMDTGGAIKGNKIDILVSSKTEARKLGRVQAKVVWKQ